MLLLESVRSITRGKAFQLLLAQSALLVMVLALSGCASPHLTKGPRKFDFAKDTFAYANELVWEYGYDTNGVWTSRRREPPPEYSLHCFVVARSACQFFENARFDPDRARTNEATYRRLIRQVIKTNPRKPLPPDKAIVIPGYPDLRTFSQEKEKLLKAECGGAWQSYFQRGNWRMIFPFTRHHQLGVAQRAKSRLEAAHPVIVHLVRFPQLSINHSVVLIGVREADQSLLFDVYDPNDPANPATLTFDYSTNTFILPPDAYFKGGRVDVYELCHRWDY